MATYGAPSTAIVHEVLKGDNYKYWRACMESYLKVHDLWETVSPGLRDGENETTEWKKKDSAALHAILISCGPQFFPEIEGSSSARDAWEILANWFTRQHSGEKGNILIPSMGTFVSPNTAIVPEFLKTDNYEYWSACLQSYLEAQDLWDTISSEHRDAMTWKEKNSAALHAIQISCGPQFFPEIKDVSDAKYAWETLKNKFNPESESELESESEPEPEPERELELESEPEPEPELEPQGSDVSGEEVPAETMDDQLRAQKDEMMDHITKGNWKGLKAMLDNDPSLINARIAGDGSTALSEACLGGHKDMANYLYPKTSIDFLSQENGKLASMVLRCCILGQTLDIALDLLHRLPDSCKMDVIQNSRVLPTLSEMPEVFRSGLGLAFWQRWIYWSVRVPEFVPFGGTSQIDTGSGSQSVPVPEVVSSLDTSQIDTGSGSRIDLEPGVTTDENPTEIGEENQSKIGKIYLQVLHRLRTLYDYLLDILGIKQIRDIKHLHVLSVDLLNYICEKIKDLDKQKCKDMGMYDAFTTAASLGIFEIVLVLGEIHVDLLDYKEDGDGRNAVMLSIIHRQEKVFGALTTFFSGKGDGKVLRSIDKFGNGLLHLAGLLSPPSKLDRFSGAALQMQREMQWYKEVERFSNPTDKEWTNFDGETPRQVFTRCHKDLIAEGQKWMKDTAASCTVVGALIITIMFTAAFTVPGGNRGSGLPNFLHEASFKIFIISDAIALLTSSTSVMTFLGIFLSMRSAEQDFYRSLPTQLIIGLSSLFLSVATMLIAFCATLFMVLDGKLSYVIPITSLAAAHVVQFTFLLFSFLIDVIKSTYGRSIFSYK